MLAENWQGTDRLRHPGWGGREHLTEIALLYGKECEIMALPNVIMIGFDQSSRGHVEFAVQGLTTVQLDKVSEFVELVDHVRKKTIPLAQAIQQIDQILAKKPRFGPALIIFGYFLSCIGLTLLFRPDLQLLINYWRSRYPGWIDHSGVSLATSF